MGFLDNLKQLFGSKPAEEGEKESMEAPVGQMEETPAEEPQEAPQEEEETMEQPMEEPSEDIGEEDPTE